MHTFWYRLNALFTFSVLLLGVLCGTASFLDVFNSPSVTAHAEVSRITHFQRHPNGNDEAFFILNISADLQSLFTWNTKQVFVFLTAEYETPQNGLNQISLWDHIILDKQQAKFQTKVPAKYPLIDQGSNLRGKKVDLVLHWHIMPKTGKMFRGQLALSHLYLPEEYFALKSH